MATKKSELDVPLSGKKMRHKWAVLFVTVVLTVWRLVRAARAVDALIHAIREWLTKL